MTRLTAAALQRAADETAGLLLVMLLAGREAGCDSMAEKLAGAVGRAAACEASGEEEERES